MKKKEPRAIATLTMYGIGDMKYQKRMQIAKWLREQAKQVVQIGKEYTRGRFTARYFN